MISQTARFHGSFFTTLFEFLEAPVLVRRSRPHGVGYYVLGESIPVYLKYCTRRKGPWAFNFFRAHQEAQQALFELYGECFTCLICGQDGIAGLSMQEFRQILDVDFHEQEVISVRRKLNSMYQIKGRGGSLEKRISRVAAFEKIKTAVEEAV